TAVAGAHPARSVDVPEAAGVRFRPDRAGRSRVLLPRVAGVNRLRCGDGMRRRERGWSALPRERASPVVYMECDGSVRARGARASDVGTARKPLQAGEVGMKARTDRSRLAYAC